MLVVGCTGSTVPRESLPEIPRSVLLTHQTVIDAQVPDSDAPPVSARIPVEIEPSGRPGHWRVREPVRASFYRARHPSTRPPLDVYVGRRKLDFGRGKPWTWARQEDELTIQLPPEVEPDTVTLRSTRLSRAINAHHPRSTSPESFIIRDHAQDGIVHHGLFLPAGSSVRIHSPVPTGTPRLRAHLDIACPPLGSCDSDGARLVIRRVDHTEPTTLLDEVVAGETIDVDVELAAVAGEHVELEWAVHVEGSPDADVVFVAEPAIIDVSTPPRRAGIVLVDTLRADHLGVYGYSRPTSPNLDAWAEDARVFTEAAAPAPWTLPSSRALFTGRHPEEWSQAELIAAPFGRAGFTSVSLAANRYLSVDYGLTSGFSTHEAYHPQRADVAAQRLSQLVERYEDRDLLAIVHIMDPHSPYRESSRFRRRWEGRRPRWIPPGNGSDVFQQAWDDNPDPRRREQLIQWLHARYDQNILQVDDALPAIFEALGEDATVVFTSDHGEAFFEHGWLGHSRELTEPTIHIPFIVKGPDIEPGWDDSTVTLMDLLPTLAERFGATASDVDGRSLQPALTGDSLPDIPIGVGRNMFGPTRWAVLEDGMRFEIVGFDALLSKRSVLEARTATPREIDRWVPHLGAALGRPIERVWRFAVPSNRGSSIPRARTTKLTLHRDVGLPTTWPRHRSDGVFTQLTPIADGISIGPKAYVPNELFVLADGRPEGLSVDYQVDGDTYSWSFTEVEHQRWGRIGPEAAPLAIGPALQPLPVHVSAARETDDFDRQALEALGYAE